MTVRIFTGNSNPELARAICAYLGTDLGRARVSNFSDGETRVEIDESVRGADVYVIQSTCTPVNDNLMELLIMVDALKRASAGSISASSPQDSLLIEQTAHRVKIMNSADRFTKKVRH